MGASRHLPLARLSPQATLTAYRGGEQKFCGPYQVPHTDPPFIQRGKPTTNFHIEIPFLAMSIFHNNATYTTKIEKNTLLPMKVFEYESFSTINIL